MKPNLPAAASSVLPHLSCPASVITSHELACCREHHINASSTVNLSCIILICNR